MASHFIVAGRIYGKFLADDSAQSYRNTTYLFCSSVFLRIRYPFRESSIDVEPRPSGATHRRRPHHRLPRRRPPLSVRLTDRRSRGAGVGNVQPPQKLVRLTVQRLTRAARARVATAARHAACPHLKRAMSGGVTPTKLRWARRLGRRTEAGPRRVLPRVRRRALQL